MNKVGEQRRLELNELDELRNDTFYNSKFLKRRTKAFHDKFILKKAHFPKQKVLLYTSILHLFLRKLSKWHGTLILK